MENPLVKMQNVHTLTQNVIKMEIEDTTQYVFFYDEQDGKCMFAFSGDLVEILTIFEHDFVPLKIKFMATNGKESIFPDNYQGENLTDFIRFVRYYSHLSFVDVEISFTNQVQFLAHDDSEITFIFSLEINSKIIFKVLENQGFNSKEIFQRLQQNAGKYVFVEPPQTIVKIDADFS